MVLVCGVAVRLSSRRFPFAPASSAEQLHRAVSRDARRAIHLAPHASEAPVPVPLRRIASPQHNIADIWFTSWTSGRAGKRAGQQAACPPELVMPRRDRAEQLPSVPSSTAHEEHLLHVRPPARIRSVAQGLDVRTSMRRGPGPRSRPRRLPRQRVAASNSRLVLPDAKMRSARALIFRVPALRVHLSALITHLPGPLPDLAQSCGTGISFVFTCPPELARMPSSQIPQQHRACPPRSAPRSALPSIRSARMPAAVPARTLHAHSTSRTAPVAAGESAADVPRLAAWLPVPVQRAPSLSRSSPALSRPFRAASSPPSPAMPAPAAARAGTPAVYAALPPAQVIHPRQNPCSRAISSSSQRTHRFAHQFPPPGPSPRSGPESRASAARPSAAGPPADAAPAARARRTPHRHIRITPAARPGSGAHSETCRLEHAGSSMTR